MPAYTIDYLWIYNRWGSEGSRCLDQEIPLTIGFHVQPDEPDVNVQFDITIETIEDKDGNPYCTDADFECGWYQEDEDRLLEWLYENLEDAKPVSKKTPATVEEGKV